MSWFSIMRFVVQGLGAGPRDEDGVIGDLPDLMSIAPAADASEPAPSRALMAAAISKARRLRGSLIEDVDAVCRSFDASQPVEQPGDLRGRADDLAALRAGMMFRRNHGIVAGRRGSGKTSLVRSFGQQADRDGVIVLYAAWDSGTSFGELMREYLRQIPASALDPEQAETFAERVNALGPDSTPSTVTNLCALITSGNVIIVCDEFDRVTDMTVQANIAAMMKHVSDARLPIRFLLAGDFTAFDTVFRSHSSLSRHVTLVLARPLSIAAMRELLNDCAARCGVSFVDDALAILVETACGSPYHGRLFGLHAALSAIENPQKSIGRREAFAGLERAFDEWAMLNQAVGEAFRSAARGVHGDPARYLAVASAVANTAGETNPGVALTPSEHIALAPTLEPDREAIRFRDPIAAQFLIAVCLLSSELNRFVQKSVTHA